MSPAPEVHNRERPAGPRHALPSPEVPERWIDHLSAAVGELVRLTRLERSDPWVWKLCCDRIEVGCAAVDPSMVSMSCEEAAVAIRPSSVQADRDGLSDDLALLVEVAGDRSTPKPRGRATKGSSCYGVRHLPLLQLTKADRDLAGLVSSLRAIVYRARASASLDPTSIARLEWSSDQLRQLCEPRDPTATTMRSDARGATPEITGTPDTRMCDRDWIEVRSLPKPLARRVRDLVRERARSKIPADRIGGFLCVRVPELVRALRPEFQRHEQKCPGELPEAVRSLL